MSKSHNKTSKLSRNKRTEAAKQAAERQKQRTPLNKARKLLRHILRHPNDGQAKKASK